MEVPEEGATANPTLLLLLLLPAAAPLPLPDTAA